MKLKIKTPAELEALILKALQQSEEAISRLSIVRSQDQEVIRIHELMHALLENQEIVE